MLTRKEKKDERVVKFMSESWRNPSVDEYDSSLKNARSNRFEGRLAWKSLPDDAINTSGDEMEESYGRDGYRGNVGGYDKHQHND